MNDFTSTYLSAIGSGILLSVIALFWIIFTVRVIGLRSFSKMTAFDFIVTLAIGSLLASAATASNISNFIQALTAIMSLLIIQFLLAKGRFHFKMVRKALENAPALLAWEGQLIPEAMKKHRVTEEDILSKLRGRNITSLQDVKAVILETTGDISIITYDAADGPKPDALSSVLPKAS